MAFDNARTLNCYTPRRSKVICIAINERMSKKTSSLFGLDID